MPATSSDNPGLSKSQRAYQVIKSRITDGSYSPGYRLVLGQLAKELSVSAVPIREAIRLLEAEGFVEFERNVGAQVAAINPTEYLHTMQTLAIVEGAAIGLAGEDMSADALDRAAELNERMRTSLREFDPIAFTRLNQRFHEALYEQCPNPHLVDLVRRGWARLASIRESTFIFVPGRASSSVEEHDKLLELLGSGADPEVIEQYARAHRTTTMQAFLSKEDGHV
ncbi:MAG: FCD domain-containing protein [Pseudonocardiaceae bacterium]|nr:FCD domain-containing protein [Pseudonocardiaceae bacterium]